MAPGIEIKKSPSVVVDALRSLRFDNTFNPYIDICPLYDQDVSPDVRSQILIDMLKAAERVEVDAIWIGRDLGYRGGRRTGLALTDDLHFAEHLARWRVLRQRPASGHLVAERTAAVIWQMLRQIDSNVFLWNVFPLHPYQSGSEFSNRAHNAKERKAGEAILKLICELVRPKRLIGVGNDAAQAAKKVACGKVEVFHVRHPSYGGQTAFCNQIKEIYSLI